MILVVDDHPLVRQGIESVLHLYKPDEEIVQVSTIEEAIEQMRHIQADIVFVDVSLKQESGFTFVEWLQKEGYESKIFFITSSSRESDYLYAQQINVDAYILKEDFIDDIIYGLKVVERGGKFYSPAIMKKATSISKDAELLHTLTTREIDVLILLSQGHSNAQISEMLFISEGTTKRHITNILSKLGVERRAEAMVFANNNHYILKAAINRGIKEDKRRNIL